MNVKGSNRSVVRTQALLKQGLTELMMNKPVQNITVKELTDYVNLNRGTFYLHYKDIYDLLEHMENDLLDEFLQINNAHGAIEMNGKPYPLLYDLFKFLKKNLKFAQLILVTNQEQKFVSKLKKILRERMQSDWNRIFVNADPVLCEIYSAYVLSGCIGVIENWLEAGAVQSPADLAKDTEQIMIKGLQILA